MATRAVLIERFGGPEVLDLREVDKPTPGPGELLVRVLASGTNPVEAKIRQGVVMPDLPLPAVLGGDVSGVVEAAGAGVSEFAAGDEVFYTPELTQAGSYADYNVVAASIVAPKPRALSHVEAAAVPLAGGTAWEAIVRRLAVRPGETVLVHAGAGGVGSFAVQFAVAAGALVLATAGPDSQDLLRELGAVPIDYHDDDPVQITLDHTGGVGADAVLDLVGGENLVKSSAAARPFGRIATVLPPAGQLTRLYQQNQQLHGIMLTRERRRLEELTPLFDRGQVRPVVRDVLPLDQVRQAHERLDSGHARGKTVLSLT
ncbi:zinc-binding dehydrogenase [Amycolatopsis sp. K13G38]|uniref:Zinc-binding dehydrogenase n=1 Tax=Amycolatopsis acididurans TaxID=2724524 RepID=A0ABX1IWN1_9PSEU|nr:zinc-binding dehydrogenase [Amycolatopsis acididurans]NKQ51734.1 zinc-binding dehydrogenase [Amycolatopsis acididurans]